MGTTGEKAHYLSRRSIATLDQWGESMMYGNKPIISAEQAAALVKDNWTLTTGGFGSCGHPEALSIALEQRFLETKSPKNLNLVFAAGQGDKDKRGLNRLAHEGLLKRVIGGYWALTPGLGQLAKDEAIEAYNLPQGIVSHLFRAIANKSPGILSKIGLGTFIDPRYGGGKLNLRSSEDLVEVAQFRGDEFLFFPAFSIHCAMIRGTRADERGNLTMEDEANFQDSLAQALAARSSGGIVIAQVKEVVEAGTLNPHDVKIPGILVDYLVVARQEDHWQTYGEFFNRAYTGSSRPIQSPNVVDIPLDVKRIIARRAWMEIGKSKAPVINLGIGTPEMIARISEEEQSYGHVLTIESGTIGGSPAAGLSFGASRNPEAILDQPSQFDFYNGGGIDLAFLGMGQVDSEGNVNVSRLGDRINGVGGFINISQTAKKVVFCGAFSSSGLSIQTGDGRLAIKEEGIIQKFVKKVDQLSFSAAQARLNGQEVMYVTERAIFSLDEDGLVLKEVAPGIDVYSDVIRLCSAKVHVPAKIEQMSSKIFRNESMTLGWET